MSTQIVQCDCCEKVAKQTDAHGWLDVRVWVTKPTQEQFDAAMANPENQIRAKEYDIKPAPTPALVGGDFCTMSCLLKYYSEQDAVRHAIESDAVEPDRGASGPTTTEPERDTKKPPPWPENRGYM